MYRREISPVPPMTAETPVPPPPAYAATTPDR